MVEEDVKVAPGLRAREGSGGKKVLEVSVHPSPQTAPLLTATSHCVGPHPGVLTISRGGDSMSSATSFAFLPPEMSLGLQEFISITSVV